MHSKAFLDVLWYRLHKRCTNETFCNFSAGQLTNFLNILSILMLNRIDTKVQNISRYISCIGLGQNTFYKNMHYSRSLLPVLANNLRYQSVLAINLMYWPSRYRLMCIGLSHSSNNSMFRALSKGFLRSFFNLSKLEKQQKNSRNPWIKAESSWNYCYPSHDERFSTLLCILWVIFTSLRAF